MTLDEWLTNFLNDLSARLPKVNISCDTDETGGYVILRFRYGLLEGNVGQPSDVINDSKLPMAEKIAALVKKSLEEQRLELSDDARLIHDYLIGELPDDVKVYEARYEVNRMPQQHEMGGGVTIPMRTIPEEGIRVGASAEHNAVCVYRG